VYIKGVHTGGTYGVHTGVHTGYIQGTYRVHIGYIQGTYRVHTRPYIQGTYRVTFRVHTGVHIGYIQGYTPCRRLKNDLKVNLVYVFKFSICVLNMLTKKAKKTGTIFAKKKSAS